MLERLIREEYQKYLEKIFYIDTFSEDFLKKIALERKGVEKSTLKILCENGKYNVKNEKGEILLKEWVDSITPFSSNGFYLVQKKKKYNILNRQGVLISKEWFSSVSEFHEGFAVVTRFAGRHNFISENGKFLLKKDVQAALDFCNGYATIVKYNDLFPAYNFVNSLGQVLFPEWHYDYFFSSDPELGFKDGFITIWEHGLAIKYEAYINLLGEKSWEKEDVYFLKNGYKILQKKDSLVLLDPQNNPLYETLKKEGAPLSSFFSFGWKPSDLHERQFQKKAFSYELREKDFLYSLKYEPVHLYEWYILCKKESCYYLYSKETYEYIFLAEDSTFTYGRNYFSYQERTFFVGKEIKDVSGIVVKYSLELKDPTCEFLEYDEFKKTLDESFYERALERLKQENIELGKEEKKRIQRMISDHLQYQELERKQRIESTENRMKNSFRVLSETLKDISSCINELEELKNEAAQISSIRRIDVPEDLLFITVFDHKELHPFFLSPGILRYIDLSLYSFDNVKISGVDLSYTNAEINPQTVYGKDMRNGNYQGLDFSFKSFEGVLTEGAIFDETQAYYHEALKKNSFTKK